MDNVHIVTIDNGDSEPEVWVFAQERDAERYATLRQGAHEEYPVQSADAAARLFRDEEGK